MLTPTQRRVVEGSAIEPIGFKRGVKNSNLPNMSRFVEFVRLVRRSSLKKRITNGGTGYLNRRGQEIAAKSTRGASSKRLSFEEIKASLTRLEAEMAERKPQRGSSKRNILKRRSKALKRLSRGVADLRERDRTEMEHIKKTMEVYEEEEKEDIAPRKEMNEEELEEIGAYNDWLNPLISAVIHGHQNEDQSERPPRRGQLQI